MNWYASLPRNLLVRLVPLFFALRKSSLELLESVGGHAQVDSRNASRQPWQIPGIREEFNLSRIHFRKWGKEELLQGVISYLSSSNFPRDVGVLQSLFCRCWEFKKRHLIPKFPKFCIRIKYNLVFGRRRRNVQLILVPLFPRNPLCPTSKQSRL